MQGGKNLMPREANSLLSNSWLATYQFLYLWTKFEHQNLLYLG